MQEIETNVNIYHSNSDRLKTQLQFLIANRLVEIV